MTGKGKKSGKSGKQQRLRAAKVWVPATADVGFRLVITDTGLPVKVRLRALGRLFSPSQQFLMRLIRDGNTPGRLRMAASERLAQVQQELHERQTVRQHKGKSQ
jgi:hypothetical protein